MIETQDTAFVLVFYDVAISAFAIEDFWSGYMRQISCGAWMVLGSSQFLRYPSSMSHTLAVDAVLVLLKFVSSLIRVGSVYLKPSIRLYIAPAIGIRWAQNTSQLFSSCMRFFGIMSIAAICSRQKLPQPLVIYAAEELLEEHLAAKPRDVRVQLPGVLSVSVACPLHLELSYGAGGLGPGTRLAI